MVTTILVAIIVAYSDSTYSDSNTHTLERSNITSTEIDSVNNRETLLEDLAPSITDMETNSIYTAIIIHKMNFNEIVQGTNTEISQTLLNDSSEPKPAAIILPRVNDKGKFVDSWGTHFDIHVLPKEPVSPQNSGSVVEVKIVSAGPNKIFGDEDDYVLEKEIYQ
ncbi:hypothetical protein [Candidatus Albibeggiatoa sp. nov. BB20]|uniref:hypothetical protein n=1 Tax=Candidatus Albibeggiatoa sp. nov. BB20 TaxID=3162723 RepID=UPI0033657CEC